MSHLLLSPDRPLQADAPSQHPGGRRARGRSHPLRQVLRQLRPGHHRPNLLQPARRECAGRRGALTSHEDKAPLCIPKGLPAGHFRIWGFRAGGSSPSASLPGSTHRSESPRDRDFPAFQRHRPLPSAESAWEPAVLPPGGLPPPPCFQEGPLPPSSRGRQRRPRCCPRAASSDALPPFLRVPRGPASPAPWWQGRAFGSTP